VKQVCILIAMSVGVASATSIPGATAQVMNGAVLVSGQQQETFTITPGTSGSISLNSMASTASSSANTTTGQLHLNIQGTTTPGATVDPYDFLTFNGSGAVSYSLNVTGSLNNAAPDGDVSIGGAVYFYNVTGATSDVFTTSSNGSEYINTGYLPTASSGQTFDIYGPSYPSYDLPITYQNFIVTTEVNDSGAAIPVDVTATGTLNVVAGDTYAIQLLLTGGSDQPGKTGDQQGANFGDTATFRFTNLNGLTYTSASGAFLSNTGAVPEPSTLPLAGAALLGLGLAAGRRKLSKLY
jgi:hypothetical protein